MHGCLRRDEDDEPFRFAWPVTVTVHQPRRDSRDMCSAHSVDGRSSTSMSSSKKARGPRSANARPSTGAATVLGRAVAGPVGEFERQRVPDAVVR